MHHMNLTSKVVRLSFVPLCSASCNPASIHICDRIWENGSLHPKR